MNRLNSRGSSILVAGCLLVIVLTFFYSRKRTSPADSVATRSTTASETMSGSPSVGKARTWRRPDASAEPGRTAEEIVASKVSQFARNRRGVAEALARRAKVAVPADAEQFFTAVESGDWESIKAAFEQFSQRKKALAEQAGDNRDPGAEAMLAVWPAVLETFGAAEQAHEWPAQRLLDYGNAVLDSLRPGMVYFGGTDPGRFVPTLLNETSEGERHVIITQNALADQSYLSYVNFLYNDRLATLGKEDSDRAFQDYLSDARKRMEHDQQFPNEPKQLRPGEDVRVVDNKVQVSGQVAVMAINEKLVQAIMDKNPNASFAMEESYPLKSMFAEASALGPIMELRVQGEQNALTRDRAAQSVDYWRTTTQQLLSDAGASASDEVRKTYSKMVASQAGLFVDRGFAAEAEQAFQLANQISPASPEAVYRYINLLGNQNRWDDAIPVAEAARAATQDAAQGQQFEILLQEIKKQRRKSSGG